jgi:DNA-binding NtrC family response regulator
MAAILKLAGYEAHYFFDPEAALEAIQTLDADLLISDVMMPQLSGIDLAIVMKKLRPTCKVLLLSGAEETGQLLDAAREQGHEFEVLAKPIHPDSLLAQIRDMDVSDDGVA